MNGVTKLSKNWLRIGAAEIFLTIGAPLLYRVAEKLQAH
jgi:hypothetical protein